jgi:hypothetical protein
MPTAPKPVRHQPPRERVGCLIQLSIGQTPIAVGDRDLAAA